MYYSRSFYVPLARVTKLIMCIYAQSNITAEEDASESMGGGDGMLAGYHLILFY